MIERREDPAACVFEDKIIVSGGMQQTDEDFINAVNYYDEENYQATNKVEAYDPIDDTRTEFPNMNYSRCLHKSVVVKNKLFVIAGGTYINEVYDSNTKKLKSSLILNHHTCTEYLHLILLRLSVLPHKLFTFYQGSNIHCFDTVIGKWNENSSEPTKNLSFFSAIQVPRL